MLAVAPGRQAQIAQAAIQQAIELARFAGGALKAPGEPSPPQAQGLMESTVAHKKAA